MTHTCGRAGWQDWLASDDLSDRFLLGAQLFSCQDCALNHGSFVPPRQDEPLLARGHRTRLNSSHLIGNGRRHPHMT